MVTDVELGDLRDRGEGPDVASGQAVTSRDYQADALCVYCGPSNSLDLAGSLAFAFAMRGPGREGQVSILSCTDLDLLGSGLFRCIDLFDIGIDENAHKYSA